MICAKCEHLGYDINRYNGKKVPMCNCFPVFRILEYTDSQPEWCPDVYSKEKREGIK